MTMMTMMTMMHRRHMFALTLGAMLAACVAEGSGTGGRAVVYEVALEPPSYMTDGAAFVTASGWEVELSEAVVAVGPFYLYEDAPALAEATDDELDLLAFVGDLLVPTAHAHPGDTHYNGGTLRGEYLGQVAFDLLGGETVSLGVARGIAGEVGSVTVVLDPPSGATMGETDALQGHHAWVVGVARRDGVEIEFEGGLDLGEELIQRQVDGVRIDLELDDDGTLVVGVHPRRWFDEAQFDTLTEVADSGRMLITPDSQVAAAWMLGLRSPRGFFARWTDDEVFPMLAGIEADG